MGPLKKYAAVAFALLALLLLVIPTGCGGGEISTPMADAQVPEVVEVTNVATSTTEPLPFDALSTFESKDPFVVKYAPPQSTSSSVTSTTLAATTTTVTAPPVTNPSNTTTTMPPASTTTTVLHSLKVISVETIGGQPVVTFEVDRSVYADRREGDIVSTSWGQIKVVDVDPEAAEVVFLHGSEIRVLKVGQEYLQ
jgi:hypothetical protein